MMPEVPFVVAVDLGQTKILVGRVDWKGGTTAVTQVPTPIDREDLLATVDALIVERLNDCASGVAVAAAPLVDPDRGTLLWPGSLPLEDFPLRDYLVERHHRNVVVENDANAAAYGEWRVGVGQHAKNMIFLTIGTGIGGGLIIDEHLYRGAGGVAGELGHIVLDRDGPACSEGCPGFGHLEALASGTAIVRRAQEAARLRPSTLLARTLANSCDGSTVVRAARDGCPDAMAIINIAGEWLGYGITSLVNVFNPELVIIGGGVSAAGELLLGPARRIVAQAALEPARSQVRVVTAQLGTRAGLIGAGLLGHELPLTRA
jgi:glucokinase